MNTHVKTRKLLQICKHGVTRLLSCRYQDVFALLVPPCYKVDNGNRLQLQLVVPTSCYELVVINCYVETIISLVPTTCYESVGLINNLEQAVRALILLTSCEIFTRVGNYKNARFVCRKFLSQGLSSRENNFSSSAHIYLQPLITLA
jgi:hypothetical protein